MLARDADRADQFLHLADDLAPPNKLFPTPRHRVPDRQTRVIDSQPLLLKPREPAELAVVVLVLHHGDRRWNAATRLSNLFRDSVPDAYRVVARMPPDAQPTSPQDLPQVVMGFSGVTTAVRMRPALTVLRELVEACEDGDFDRFMAWWAKGCYVRKDFPTNNWRRR